MRRRAFLVGLAAALPAQAYAATRDGLTLPDTYPVAGQTLVLNGMGIRTATILKVRAYVAGLYLVQKNADARAILASPAPKVLLLQFLHTVSKKQIEQQSREGEERNCGHGECDKADEPDFERLIAAIPAAQVGDTLTYFFTREGLRVLFNNHPVAEFANPDLALRILESFIGSRPGAPELRDSLLGH